MTEGVAGDSAAMPH